MPRDPSDDAYEEWGKEIAAREAQKIREAVAKKIARRKPPRPSKACRSCGCAQKHHKGSRGECQADLEIITMSGPAPEQCYCKAFNP